MCGIVAYAGGRSALGVLLDGLSRLERPGRGCAGVTLLVDGGLAAAKKAGSLDDVRDELKVRPLPAATTGVGHVRSGAGAPLSDADAQPHLDGSGRVAVVQSGVIADHEPLRAELTARGHESGSGTDTEAAACLLAGYFSASGDLAEAMRQLCSRLKGRFSLVAVHADEPDVIVGGCRGLPLTVGVGDGETFLASDASAFAPYTREAAAVGDDARVVTVRPEGAWVTDLEGLPVDLRTYESGHGEDEGQTVGGSR